MICYPLFFKTFQSIERLKIMQTTNNVITFMGKQCVFVPDIYNSVQFFFLIL